MECPVCKSEMFGGYIYGEKYTLKWLPINKSLVLGFFAKNGIKLGEKNNVGRARV